ncbi:MAG: hypothetical protein KatS3mg028_0086 [Bacteroidia bacterium]|nr:MAG: hypothetical protein KatS3mg028_0086 [Bacteroidia bacterium]
MNKQNSHSNLSNKFHDSEYLEQFKPSQEEKEKTFLLLDEQNLKSKLSKTFFDEEYFQTFNATKNDWKFFEKKYLNKNNNKKIFWFFVSTFAIVTLLWISHNIYKKHSENINKKSITQITTTQKTNEYYNKHISHVEGKFSHHKKFDNQSISITQNHYSSKNYQNSINSHSSNIQSTKSYLAINRKHMPDKNFPDSKNNYFNNHDSAKSNTLHQNELPATHSASNTPNEQYVKFFDNSLLFFKYPEKINLYFADTLLLKPIPDYPFVSEKKKKYALKCGIGIAGITHHHKNTFDFTPFGCLTIDYSIWKINIQSGVYYYQQPIKSELLLSKYQYYDFGAYSETKKIQYNKLHVIGIPIRILFNSAYGKFSVGMSYDFIMSTNAKIITEKYETFKNIQTSTTNEKNYFAGLNSTFNTLLFKYEIPLKSHNWWLCFDSYYAIQKLQKPNFPFTNSIENPIGLRITLEYTIIK